MLVSALESSCAVRSRPREWQPTRAPSPLNLPKASPALVRLRRTRSAKHCLESSGNLSYSVRCKARSVASPMNYKTCRSVGKWLIHYVLILDRLLLIVVVDPYAY